MPFTEIPDMPKSLPAVKIFFTGQLIIEPLADGRAEVFVNRSAPNHHLTVEVRQKRPGRPDAILMRHHGPLPFMAFPDEEPTHGLFITSDSPNGVGMYTGARTEAGEEPLGLAIDLKAAGFHKDQPINIDRQGGRPSILLNAGVLYTADTTSPEWAIKLKKGGDEVREMEPFASLIGANVYLEGEAKLRVRWRLNGLPQVLELEKREDGVSYEIYVVNDPLYEDPEEAASHDEFREYYKMLRVAPAGAAPPTDVPPESRFSLEVKLKEDHPLKGSPRTPCMPLVYNGLGG